jgi:hypothetical protein
MAKQTEKPIVAGLLLFFFIGLVAVAVQFMQNPPQAPAPPKSEGFASAAPTRATDCSCLPGYVPSNIKVTNTTKSDGNNGINGIHCFNSVCYAKRYSDLMAAFGDGTTGQSKDSLINHWRNHGIIENRNPCCDSTVRTEKKTNIFFCQSLSNPADIKQCY